VADLLRSRHARGITAVRRSFRGHRGQTPLFVVAPREYDASNGEGDVEEYVETEVGSEALVIARGIATLKYLGNKKDN